MVMFITLADGEREKMIGEATESLQNYLKLRGRH
jgi:hypothetical protein